MHFNLHSLILRNLITRAEYKTVKTPYSRKETLIKIELDINGQEMKFGIRPDPYSAGK